MNKQELVAAVAAETSMPKKCVEAVLKSIVGNVVAEVAKKGKVQMIGFGT
jgi:DNA-binding protein HU-beta